MVKSGTASSLSVNFKGKAIASDITAAQIAIWNAGRMPIKRADVLRPVLIRLTTAGVPILEASLRKISREVTKVTLDETALAQNEIGVQFEILEQNDGCVIQIIYAGPPDVPFAVSGVIIGQHSPQELRYGGSISSPADQYVKSERSNRASAWSMLLTGSLFGAFTLFARYKRPHGTAATWPDRVMLIMPLILIAIGIFEILMLGAPEPPFGFR